LILLYKITPEPRNEFFVNEHSSLFGEYISSEPAKNH
jgi:hypothetical protein